MDDEGTGYFIAMDFVNGFVQIRRWGFNPLDYHNNFTFYNLQTGIFEPATDRKIQFRLICYGYYYERSIYGRIVLTLVDYDYEVNIICLYSDSIILCLSLSD